MASVTLDTKTRNLILILFLMGVFMGSLDTGIIGPVLPSIEHSFSLTSRESSWIFTLFVIAFMVGSPVMAKFSDFYGRKKILIKLDIHIICNSLHGRITGHGKVFRLLRQKKDFYT